MEEVALLQMPWGVIDRGSLALGLIKRILEKKGFRVKVYYLNLRFLKYLNPGIYEIMSYRLLRIGEWLFSQHLFKGVAEGRRNMGISSLIEGLSVEGKAYGHLVSQLEYLKDELKSIIDISIPEYIEDCIKSIPWQHIRIAGFSCKVGCQISSLLLARCLKEEFPHIKIVLGGPNVFGKMGEETIKCFDWVDYVIDGECENTIADLFGGILHGMVQKEIPGILMRCGGEVVTSRPAELTQDLDSLPIPDYSEYFEELENLGLRSAINKIVIPFESTRGCWWGEKCACTFCAVNSGKPAYRSKSPGRVVDEILAQLDRYKIKSFYAADSILSMDYFNDMIPRLADMGLDIDIYHDVKPCFDRNELRLLYRAGVRTVLAGIESLDSRLLRLMRKGMTAMQNIQFLKLCNETNICVLWNLLYGIPGEDPSWYGQIISIIPAISHLRPPGGIVRISLDRFSPYQCEPEKYGIKNVRPDLLYEFIYPDRKINLGNIVYTFDYEYENCEENTGQYLRLLADTVVKWQKVFYGKKSSCECRLCGDSVEIVDTRPGIFGESNETVRRYVYGGLQKEIYMYCSEIRQFASILEYLNNKLGLRCDERVLKSILVDFEQKKLMMEGDSGFLSLAVLKEE